MILGFGVWASAPDASSGSATSEITAVSTQAIRERIDRAVIQCLL
jgi:hypothetical protein